MVEFTDDMGNRYEMPELDASMLAKQRDVDEADDIVEKAKAAWTFVRAALPKEAISDALGSVVQAKASVPRLLKLYLKVKDAYWSEYESAKADATEQRIEQLGDLPKLIDVLAGAGKL